MFEMEITIFCVCQHVHNLEIWVNWVFLKHLPFSWCAIPTTFVFPIIWSQGIFFLLMLVLDVLYLHLLCFRSCEAKEYFSLWCWSSTICNVVIMAVLGFCWFNNYVVLLYLSFGYTQDVYSIHEFPKTRPAIANLVLNWNVKEKRELNMYDEQYCFLTILAYCLGSIDCCYMRLTSILFVFWDTLDCEQEKKTCCEKIDKTIAEYKTRRKKPNKQTK